MGNTHGHGERRKSRGGHDSVSSAMSMGGMATDFHQQRRPSGNMFTAPPTKPISTPFDDVIGPLSIQAGSVDGKSRGIPPHRPRATTEVGRKLPKQHSTDVPSTYGTGAGNNNIINRDPIIKGSGYEGMPTIFKYNGSAKEVFVCGTFNDWKKLPMSRSTKDFVAIVDLKEGVHEYKFLVDGEWKNDPTSTEKVEKEGFKNNVIRVQKEDFNAYDALDMDSAAVSKLNASKRLLNGVNSYSEEYGQDFPSQGSVFEHRGGPPILPPHLLQVILNKDTPLSCEPTLLPEPNHVMLNHLYALSIKDGVMVLSSTQRYKKKYVTTLLYKPMGSRKD